MAKAVRRFPECKMPNPFTNPITFTPWMRIKLALGFVLLLPLRLVVCVLFVPIVWLLCSLAGMGWKPGQHQKPWQQILTGKVAPIVGRAWLFLGFGYYWVPVRGRRASAAEAPINIFCPHSHILETLFAMAFFPITPLSRIENKNIVIIGTILSAGEPIFVDRGAGAGGTVQSVKERIRSPGNWLPVMLSPEGTLSNARQVIGFKTGAFAPAAPIQGVLLRYRLPEVGVWTSFSRGPATSFLLTLCQWRNHLEIEFMPVYTPSAEEQADPLLYSRNFKRLVASTLDLPATEHTLEDLRLIYQATDAGLPVDAALIEYNLISRAFGVRLPELKAILERYVRINTSKSGAVSLQEFADHLRWPLAEQVERLFTAYDTVSDCGRLRYREYVVGTLDLALKVPDQDNLIALAFDALSNGQEQLTVDSVLACFRERGFEDVSGEGDVSAFLYKMSQSGDLHSAGFTAYVQANADLLVYLCWLMHGVDSI
ncbi:lysophosphatidylcholine acyltransferase 2-like [Sycon ciliatum]|uniref:lysophosphatidylcholine acyltransferase 2-like n=1 Tax=Sycon ciliatum TaxID=27933 RepID=UPI0031F6F491